MMQSADESDTSNSGPEDHRVRVARERRRRMRARLQQAILACCTGRVEFRLPAVEEVCRSAGISRATFYTYFDSVQDAVDTLGQAFLDEMVDNLEVLFDGDSGIERITMGLQLFLMRSATDPAWASFVSRVIQVNPDAGFRRRVVADLNSAIDAGDIRVIDVDAAVSLSIGAMFEAIRHIHKTGDRRREYVENLTAMIIRALGVSDDTAAELVRKKAIHLRGMAPDFLDWWRDPWV